MRILIITQDEPFYLSKNLEYLFNLLPKSINVVGCIVNDVSPFGKKESFLKKAIKTLNIFGFKFFFHYTFKFIYSKIFSKKIPDLLKEYNIEEIRLNESINSKNSLELIRSFSPDLLVSILGNQIFKKDLINLAPKGCINLHTALLPKYRGLMPTFWVLKNNEEFTGVSVFFVDEGIDSGPIIIQKKVKINNMTQAELIMVTKKLGMEAIADSIKMINNNKVILIENPDSKKTYFKFPKKSDVNQFLKIGKKFF